MVGRRFWPHGSLDNASHSIQLATDLQRQGATVEILTPRYAASWAKEFYFREMPIHRPAIAPRSDWSMGRYTRHLTKWLREQSERYDVVLVDGAREETIAAIDARSTTNRPVIVRTGMQDQQSDFDWWHSSRSGQRCGQATGSADAIITHSSVGHRELLGRSIANERITRINVGVPALQPPSQTMRVEARRALSAINRDLHAPIDEPIAICVRPMEPAVDNFKVSHGASGAALSRVDAMVQSARHLVSRYPLLHLWFIGDGSQRDLVYETLRGDGVRASIAMPGSFGNMEDVYAAADAFVQLDTQGLSHFLPRAVAANLPIVAADLQEVREVLDCKPAPALNLVDDREKTEIADGGDSGEDHVKSGDEIAWFDPSTPKTFRKAMRNVFDDIETAKSKADSLRRRLLRTRPQSETVRQYLTLCETVVAKRRSSDQGPSMGAVS